jgi:cell division protein FtsW
MAVTAHPTRLRAEKPDYWIMAAAGALVVLGILMVYSSSFALGLVDFGDPNYFVMRQTAFAVIGATGLWLMMKVDYRLLRYLSPLLMLAAIVGLFAVLMPGIGVERNGSTRWIMIAEPIPPIQPSEFAKLALVIYVSAWLAGKGDGVKSFWMGFFPCVVLVGFVAGLVMLEPDLGTTLILIATTMTLVFVAGASLRHLAAFGGVAVVVVMILIAAGDYRAERFWTFWDAEKDPDGSGFQTLQMLIALGSGGWDGLGLGASRQKFFYVPGAHTDGVFAIIGEELGFIGCMVVIALFALLIARGFRTVLRARDDFGSLLAVGIVSWVAFQALINIAGITRSLPLTGIPLPFLSYGGSSLLAMLAGIGILLSVSRYGVDPNPSTSRQVSADGGDDRTKMRPAGGWARRGKRDKERSTRPVRQGTR